MNRKEYLLKALKIGACAGALLSVDRTAVAGFSSPGDDVECDAIRSERDFLRNWLSDLLESVEKNVDDSVKVKLMEACGKACYERHHFKKELSVIGKNDINELIEAYSQYYEIWREGNIVHIRYGEVSSGCYCPAARFRKPVNNDLHCECSRSTHQTIFENALNRSFKVDILESVRRGGKTCHFAVHL